MYANIPHTRTLLCGYVCGVILALLIPFSHILLYANGAGMVLTACLLTALCAVVIDITAGELLQRSEVSQLVSVCIHVAVSALVWVCLQAVPLSAVDLLLVVPLSAYGISYLTMRYRPRLPI